MRIRTGTRAFAYLDLSRYLYFLSDDEHPAVNSTRLDSTSILLARLIDHLACNCAANNCTIPDFRQRATVYNEKDSPSFLCLRRMLPADAAFPGESCLGARPDRKRNRHLPRPTGNW